ncbi:hypothetical protein AAur_2397 [Paenarthrobacter aurescens TC1]|uniref:Uncharacterized protein n=1 Tax=Paenarthrobacter aurescens (strain TC1) TaxID=290340 RepID=A1R7B7_PAEAT|nr:hypothetical protein AAur_2397 [Paenarthrobacter aurescens TC1]
MNGTPLWMAEWLRDEQANRTGKQQGSRRMESPRRRTLADHRGRVDDDGLHTTGHVILRSARVTVHQPGRLHHSASDRPR